MNQMNVVETAEIDGPGVRYIQTPSVNGYDITPQYKVIYNCTRCGEKFAVWQWLNTPEVETVQRMHDAVCRPWKSMTLDGMKLWIDECDMPTMIVLRPRQV